MMIQYDPATGIIVAWGQFDSAPPGLLLGFVLDAAPLYQPGIKRLVDGVVVVEYVEPEPLPTVADERIPVYQQYDEPPAPEGAAVWMQPTPIGDSLDVYTTMPDREGWVKSIDPLTLRQNIASAAVMAAAATTAVTKATPRTDALEAWRATAEPALATLQTSQDAQDAQIALRATSAALTALVARVAALEAQAPIRTVEGSTTGLLLAVSKPVAVTWTPPFPDDKYIVQAIQTGGTANGCTFKATNKTGAGCTLGITAGLLAGTVSFEVTATAKK